MTGWMRWAGLVARLVVGGVWVVAGWLKLGDPAESVRAVRAYDLLPEGLVTVLGHGLPVLELVVGLCLLLGLLTRPAAVVSAVLLVAFVIGISSAWARGLSIECGCFGGGGGPAKGAADKYPWELARDVGLLLLSALLVWRPRTPYAVDSRVLPAPRAATADGTAGRSRTASRAAEIRREAQVEAARRRGRVVTAVGVAILALVVAIGASVQSSRDTTGEVAAQAPRGVVDRYAVPFGGGDAPKVVVDVYEDFMCPFCGQLETGSVALVQEYADQGVQFRYRVISFLDKASTTDYSTRAMNAYAAVLDVAGPEVAKKFHDALYAQQPAEGSAGLSDDDLVQLAIAAGADADAVERPIRDLAYEQWVRNATDAASRAKVTGTPTVVVDGKRLPPAGTDETLAGLRAAIEEKLS